MVRVHSGLPYLSAPHENLTENLATRVLADRHPASFPHANAQFLGGPYAGAATRFVPKPRSQHPDHATWIRTGTGRRF